MSPPSSSQPRPPEHTPTEPRALLRVKNLKGFMDGKANSMPGYKNAHVTLLCSITPRDLRQWRASGPALYNF